MTRPAVTLSREMKILLTALGLVALLGGWMVLNNRQSDTTTVVEPPAARSTNAQGNTGTAGSGSGNSLGTVDETTTPVTPNSTATSSGGGLQVGTEGQTDVATVPPFPVTGPNGTTPDPTIVAAVPRGINPNQPLNGLNGNNPFRPVRIEAGGGTPAGTLASNPTSNPADNSGSGAVTITRPSTPPSGITSAMNNPSTGALSISPIAGAETTAPTSSYGGSSFGGSSESGSSSASGGSGSRGNGVTTTTGGAFPAPTIPGIPAGNGVTVVGASPTNGGNSPTTTIKVPGAGSGSGNSSGANSPTGTGASSTPTAPVRPPVAGVREPGTVNVPSANVPSANVPGANVPGAGASAGSKGNTAGAGNTTPSGELGNPSVMTDLGMGNASNGAGTTAASALEASISQHQLVFDAAVLGPVNTAVFRSDKGYVVATVGDTIPNTNIVLKEVTANSATLAVGNDKKVLELDKR